MERTKDASVPMTPTATSADKNMGFQRTCDQCGHEDGYFSIYPRNGSMLCNRCSARFDRAKFIRSARRDTEEILVRAGFPQNLASKTTSDLKTKGVFTPKRKQEVLDLSFSIFKPEKRTKRGICFIGPVGRGKTFLATLMARHFVRKGYDERSVAMCQVSDLIMKVRDQHCLDFNERETMENILGHFTEKGFLVIDDLGVRRGEATPSEQSLLYQLIKERYLSANRTFTVITTNRAPVEIERDIDPRVMSRIAGICHIIPLDGPDWRLEA